MAAQYFCHNCNEWITTWPHSCTGMPYFSAGASATLVTYSNNITLNTAMAEAEVPTFDVELGATPIIGHRIWLIRLATSKLVTFDDAYQLLQGGEEQLAEWFAPQLVGVGYHTPWEGPVSKAVCVNTRTQHAKAPATGCACGTWAFKDETAIRDAYAKYILGEKSLQPPAAWGTVRLWGNVIEHENGWRAEYAQPVEITVIGISEKEAEALAQRYRCQVTLAEAAPFDLRVPEASYAAAFAATLKASQQAQQAMQPSLKRMQQAHTNLQKALQAQMPTTSVLQGPRERPSRHPGKFSLFCFMVALSYGSTYVATQGRSSVLLFAVAMMMAAVGAASWVERLIARRK